MTVRRMAVVSIAALLSFASPRALPDETAFFLADIAWMEGHWTMERDGGRADEVWMAPLDGSMVGSLRWVVPGQMHVLEFLVIEQQGAEVILRFKHFHRDYRAWEDSPNIYRLVRVEDGTATFEDVDCNGRIPQFLIYSRQSSDQLTFRGDSPDGQGEPLILEYERAK